MPVLKPVFGIFAVLGWVILLGLHLIWRVTFGWLFKTLADLIDVGIPIPHFHDPHPFKGVANWLRSLDRNVDAALVKAANELEHTAVWLFSRVGHVFDWLGSRVASLALTVEHAIRKLIAVTIPRLIRRALALVWRELRALGRYARKMIPKLARQLSRFTRWAVHEIAKGAKHLGFVVKWAKAVLKLHWRVISGLVKRALALERKLLPKPFRGLVMGALTGIGAGWIIGRNIVRLANWINRLSNGAIYEFVTDAVEITGTTDMCQLAAYQYDLAVFVFEPIMQELIGLEDWFCFHQGDSLPSAVKSKPGYLLAWAPSATSPLDTLKDVKRLAPNVPLPRGVLSA